MAAIDALHASRDPVSIEVPPPPGSFVLEKPRIASGLLEGFAAKTPVDAGSWRWALQDSNLGPSGYEPVALTN